MMILDGRAGAFCGFLPQSYIWKKTPEKKEIAD
jgi:hypothetical protein